MKKNILFAVLLSCSLLSQAQDPIIPTAHKDLVIKYTADWCIYCGGVGWNTMDTLWDQAKSGSLNAVVVAVHSSSKPTLNAIGGVAGIEGNMVPSLSVMPSFSAGTKNLNNPEVAVIKAQVVANTAIVPIANTGFFVKWATGNKSVSINTTTKFFSDDTGIYSVGVYAYEDGVMAVQAARGSLPVAHKAVVRTSTGVTAFGSQLLGISSVTAGQKVTGTYTMSIPTSWNKANLKFFAAVWKYKGYGLGWELINVNDIVSVSTGIENVVNDELVTSVYPNPAIDYFTIAFPQNVDQCLITLLDYTGKKIAELYNGSVESKAEGLRLGRPSNLAQGEYFLQINSEKGNQMQRITFK